MSTPEEPKGISRRDFLKGAAVGAVAVAGTGIMGACAPKVAAPTPEASTQAQASFEITPDPIPASEIKTTVDADVVIVGAGDSGLTAALAASEAGAKVVVIEKSETFNGRGFGNGAIGTKFHTQQGIQLDKKKIVNELMRWAGNKAEQPRIEMWANHSGEVYDHIIDLATAAGLAVTLFPAADDPALAYPEYPTCLVFGSKMDQLELLGVIEAEDKKNGVDFHYSMSAEQLVRDSSGRVTAVIASDSTGAYTQFNAKNGVILSTGDYGHNQEMLDKWCPWVKNVDAVIYTPAVNTGDGHKMGLWAGAALQDYPHAAMIHTLGGGPLSMNPGLRVNMLGERYENEDVPNPYICNSRMRQPGNVVWAVYDSQWADTVVKQDPGFGRTTAADGVADSIDTAVKNGTVLKSDTVEGLATAMGVPADALKATLERYTELAKNQDDEDFGKRANNLGPIDTAPFYATKVAAVLLVTLGGLKVNTNLEVLDPDSKVIPGLYAAGNVAGGFYANDYPVLAAGLSHGRCITEGYLAGQSASKAA